MELVEIFFFRRLSRKSLIDKKACDAVIRKENSLLKKLRYRRRFKSKKNYGTKIFPAYSKRSFIFIGNFWKIIFLALIVGHFEE